MRKDGYVIWLSGLPGGGQRFAESLAPNLAGRQCRVDVLKRDNVRARRSEGLDFLLADREGNVSDRFSGWTVRYTQGGSKSCSNQPVHGRGERVRICSKYFVEVHLATPIAERMKLIRKRLHARALVGMSNRYEASLRPKLQMATTGVSDVDETRGIVRDLEQRGFEG